MILEILRDSWKFTVRNWKLLLAVEGIAALVVSLLDKTIGLSSAPALLFGREVLVLIMAILGIGVAAWAVDIDKRGGEVSPRNYMQNLGSWFPIALMASILSMAITLLGFLLLIVPGILAGIALFLVPQVAIVERPRSVLLVLKRSRQLTKGYFWSIVALLLITTLPFAAITYPISTILHGNWLSFVLTLPIEIASWVAESVVTIFLYFKLSACKMSDRLNSPELA